MPCPQCQHPTNDTAKFCEECGTRLVHVCTHCGHAVSPRAKFCEECATPLAGYASSSSSALPTRQGTEAEKCFQALLLGVMGLLQRDRRVTYQTSPKHPGSSALLVKRICPFDVRSKRCQIGSQYGLVSTINPCRLKPASRHEANLHSNSCWRSNRRLADAVRELSCRIRCRKSATWARP